MTQVQPAVEPDSPPPDPIVAAWELTKYRRAIELHVALYRWFSGWDPEMTQH